MLFKYFMSIQNVNEDRFVCALAAASSMFNDRVAIQFLKIILLAEFSTLKSLISEKMRKILLKHSKNYDRKDHIAKYWNQRKKSF